MQHKLLSNTYILLAVYSSSDELIAPPNLHGYAPSSPDTPSSGNNRLSCVAIVLAPILLPKHAAAIHSQNGIKSCLPVDTM